MENRNNVRKAKVKATGETIEVYKYTLGGMDKNEKFRWIDSNDCETEYKEIELEFMK